MESSQVPNPQRGVQKSRVFEVDTTEDGYLEQLYFTQGLKRTNRAIFVKFQYLFRY